MNTAEPIKDIRDVEKLKAFYPDPSKNRLLILFALDTGLRISDVLQAKVGESLKGEWKKREKKTNKESIVMLSRNMVNEVRNYKEAEGLSDDDYLFYSNKRPDQPIDRTQAHRIISKAGKEALNMKLSAHSLRKTMGYFSYKNGTDISVLMELFNHSSVNTTLRYIGRTQDEINKARINAGLV